MSELTSDDPAITEEKPGRLRRGSIGVAGMVFMVVAATAPLTAMASNLSLSLGFGAGEGTLGWIVLIGLLLVVFTSGYVALARTVVSAGAYHAYISHGLGPATGSAAAFVAAIAYNLATAGMIVAAGFFTDLTLATYAGIDLHWSLYSAVVLVLVGLSGHFGVGVASRLTTVVSLAQFVLLAVLAVAVLVQRPEGFSPEGFTPTATFSGGFALTAVFVLLSFAGYEAAAVYGEECNAPGRKITQATYLALGLLVLVFLISTWTIIASYADVAATAGADPGSVLGGAADRYLGSFTGAVISGIVAFSFAAAAVAFHSLSTRYAFALGRAGLLPAALGRTHPVRSTPYVAVIGQIVVDLAIIVPFAIGGADPLSALFPAVSGVTSLALIALMATCSVSAVVASVRGTLNGGGTFATRVCPTVAALGLVTVGALIVANYPQVTGSDSPAVIAMPGVLVVGALAGAWAARRGSADLSTV